MLDEMQRLGQLKYKIKYIFLSFPVFVVYKTNANREKKVGAMVNIQKLNDLVNPDVYLLPCNKILLPAFRSV